MQVPGPSHGVRAAYQLPPVARPAPSGRPVGEPDVGTLPAAAPAAGPVPAGSDPALWAVLTSEERSFFIRQAALGPLSYGPGRSPAAPPDAPLGQRLDVRA